MSGRRGGWLDQKKTRKPTSASRAGLFPSPNADALHAPISASKPSWSPSLGGRFGLSSPVAVINSISIQ